VVKSYCLYQCFVDFVVDVFVECANELILDLFCSDYISDLKIDPSTGIPYNEEIVEKWKIHYDSYEIETILTVEQNAYKLVLEFIELNFGTDNHCDELKMYIVNNEANLIALWTVNFSNWKY
jgi:hypothetical protein